MTEHYVTLFDSGFLPQGLALFRSLSRHGGDFKLWVVCMDEQLSKVLIDLGDPRIGVIPLADVETPEMRQARSDRSFREYCWTLTPFTPGFVFDTDKSVNRVTYVDADVWLIASPQPIFLELDESGKAVLLTEHAYSAHYDYTLSSGRFCVQFMPFVRGASDALRALWSEQTLARCSANSRHGVIGDQGYLTGWPESHPEFVHVLQKRALALGPWNAQRFPWSEGVFYHFAGLRLISSVRAVTGLYVIPQVTIDALYRPYLAEINEIVQDLRAIGVGIELSQVKENWFSSIRRRIIMFRHRRRLNWAGAELRACGGGILKGDCRGIR